MNGEREHIAKALEAMEAEDAKIAEAKQAQADGEDVTLETQTYVDYLKQRGL